jgi:copper resistance protein C
MRSGRAAAIAVLTMLGWVTLAGIAAAHDELVSSSPADGQALDASPAMVELQFAGPPESVIGGNAVLVATAGGDEVVSTGAVEVDGVFVRQALLPDLPDGEYVVAYHVVSSDGHQVEGSTRFFVGGVPSSVGAPFGFDDPGQDDPNGGLGLPVVILVVASAFVAVVVAVVLLRRDRATGGSV